MNGIQEVVGSIPIRSTSIFLKAFRAIAQATRTNDYAWCGDSSLTTPSILHRQYGLKHRARTGMSYCWLSWLIGTMSSDGYWFRRPPRVGLHRLISLLAVLPMLMPPGVCICQFFPCHPLPANSSSSCESAEAQTEEQCCCAAHRSRTKNDSRSQPKLQHRESHLVTNSPLPDSDTHSPGCPASVAAAVSRVTILGTWAPILADLAVELMPADQRSDTSTRADFCISNDACPRSLFLCHCSLLI